MYVYALCLYIYNLTDRFDLFVLYSSVNTYNSKIHIDTLKNQSIVNKVKTNYIKWAL